MIAVKKVREYVGHTQAVYTLAPSLKPGHFLSTGAEGVVVEWDVLSGEGKKIVQAPCPVYALCILKERGLLAMGLRTGELAFVDLANGGMIKRVQLHKGSVFDIQAMTDGNRLVASSDDGTLSIWNLDTLTHDRVHRLSQKSLRTLAVHPSGKWLAVGASDNQIHLLNAELEIVNRWAAHGNSVFRLLWSKDGEVLHSSGRDALLRAWKFGDGPVMVGDVPAHQGTVNDLIHHPGRDLMFSGSMDKSIKIWDSNTLELRKVINHQKHACHVNGVNRILWHEGALYSCGDDRKVMRWKFDFDFVPRPENGNAPQAN